MISLLLSWLVLSLSVLVVAALLPGMEVRRPLDAVVIAAMLGVVNFLIGWLLFVLIGIVTLGIGFLLAFITRWVVNAIVLLLVSKLTHRLHVRSFGTALLAALLMSLIGSVAEALIRLPAA
ncbi:phage holin family protein [Ectothiorhodospiraceae bacterium 2226]|nr:phage holin family protein [Ectothiorhodospiraceae bacterium 2226]